MNYLTKFPMAAILAVCLERMLLYWNRGGHKGPPEDLRNGTDELEPADLRNTLSRKFNFCGEFIESSFNADDIKLTYRLNKTFNEDDIQLILRSVRSFNGDGIQLILRSVRSFNGNDIQLILRSVRSCNFNFCFELRISEPSDDPSYIQVINRPVICDDTSYIQVVYTPVISNYKSTLTYVVDTKLTDLVNIWFQPEIINTSEYADSRSFPPIIGSNLNENGRRRDKRDIAGEDSLFRRKKTSTPIRAIWEFNEVFTKEYNLRSQSISRDITDEDYEYGYWRENDNFLCGALPNSRGRKVLPPRHTSNYQTSPEENSVDRRYFRDVPSYHARNTNRLRQNGEQLCNRVSEISVNRAISCDHNRNSDRRRRNTEEPLTQVSEVSVNRADHGVSRDDWCYSNSMRQNGEPNSFQISEHTVPDYGELSDPNSEIFAEAAVNIFRNSRNNDSNLAPMHVPLSRSISATGPTENDYVTEIILKGKALYAMVDKYSKRYFNSCNLDTFLMGVAFQICSHPYLTNCLRSSKNETLQNLFVTMECLLEGHPDRSRRQWLSYLSQDTPDLYDSEYRRIDVYPLSLCLKPDLTLKKAIFPQRFSCSKVEDSTRNQVNVVPPFLFVSLKEFERLPSEDPQRHITYQGIRYHLGYVSFYQAISGVGHLVGRIFDAEGDWLFDNGYGIKRCDRDSEGTTPSMAMFYIDENDVQHVKV